MAFYINGWIAISDDGIHFIKGIESLDQLIVMIDQIDHPERCSA